MSAVEILSSQHPASNDPPRPTPPRSGGNEPTPPSDRLPTEVQRLQLSMEAAWKWFGQSAQQRMQGVNYFLVAAAFLWQAYARMEGRPMAAVVGLLGLAVTVVFAGVEKRTHSLVQTARKQIESIEGELQKLVPTYPRLALLTTNDPSQRSYSFWFGVLFWSMGLAFFVAVGRQGVFRVLSEVFAWLGS